MDIDTLFTDAIAGDTDAIAKLAMVVDEPSNVHGRTILHSACMDGNTERVRFIVTKLANKNLLVKVDEHKDTALHLAAFQGHAKVVGILIAAARRNSPSSATDDLYQSLGPVEDILRQTNDMGNTALHQAVTSGDAATVERLVKADATDRHVQNQGGYTPMYIAVKSGYYDVVKIICETCRAPSLDGPEGTTALHAAISQLHQASDTHKDIVTILMDSAKRSSLLENGPDNYFEALFDRTDHLNETLLSLAVLENHLDVVKLILKQDPAYKHVTGTKKNGLKSLISKASRKGYKDIVKILCEKYEAGKTANADAGHVLLIDAIKGGDKELVYDLLEYDKHLVTCKTYTNRTALHYAAFCKFNLVIDAIISAQKVVSYDPMYGTDLESPLFLAADKGFTSTIVLLMNLLPALSCVAVNDMGQNILHIAVVQNNKDMIQSILAHCPKGWTSQILNAKDGYGNTPLHLLISQGCFVPELIKHDSVNVMAINKQNWTLLDMLYFQEEVTGDQVKIKRLLDDIQATQQQEFWRINIRGRWNNLRSSVPSSTRLLKDIEFRRLMNEMMEKEHEQMKEKVKPYRERTTTQIIVTALITTVTFTVGFTMPGGYHQSGQPEEGLVLLSKKKAFKVFMVSDASALALSVTSLFVYFISSVYDDPVQVSKFDVALTVLNIVSVIAMTLTFIAGIYVVLSASPHLALTVCIICSTIFVSITVLLIKMICDRKRIIKCKV